MENIRSQEQQQQPLTNDDENNRGQEGQYDDRMLQEQALSGVWGDPIKRANILALPGKPSIAPQPGEGPGIEVTRTGKNPDGSVKFTRENVKANVFVPSMQGPTMSLAEFGELEMKAAQEREAAQKEALLLNKDEDNLTRRYNQLETDGLEDNATLFEAATYNDRAWDTWKEHNPKGSGNKAGKRF